MLPTISVMLTYIQYYCDGIINVMNLKFIKQNLTIKKGKLFDKNDLKTLSQASMSYQIYNTFIPKYKLLKFVYRVKYHG